MDTINAFQKLRKSKDINGMLELVTDDVTFTTPQWETKGKSALKKQMKKEMADAEPEMYDQSPWEELKPGKKYTRTMKVKFLLIINMKVRQTFSIRDGKIKRMVAKKA
eukprot:TRINITY_DN4116_c1_g1_i1.p1 TRINITY_DN4116_c1_g1~~TRINITY_DN4116_c1_g1_i1.p1  ORF type:complete len:126 (+),score=31.62 TRINITY_DN4116_c1_g1_i1:57-380(+)